MKSSRSKSEQYSFAFQKRKAGATGKVVYSIPCTIYTRLRLNLFSLNCQIELHQPNKNPHRSNASPTSLTQSLHYIYKMSLNLIIRTDVYYKINTKRFTPYLVLYIQEYSKLIFKLLLLVIKIEQNIQASPSTKLAETFSFGRQIIKLEPLLCTSDKLIFLLLVRQYFQRICYLFVIDISVIIVISLIFN